MNWMYRFGLAKVLAATFIVLTNLWHTPFIGLAWAATLKATNISRCANIGVSIDWWFQSSCLFFFNILGMIKIDIWHFGPKVFQYFSAITKHQTDWWTHRPFLPRWQPGCKILLEAGSTKNDSNVLGHWAEGQSWDLILCWTTSGRGWT